MPNIREEEPIKKGPPPPPMWSLEKVIQVMQKGRSVLIVTDVTARRKYEQAIIKECTKYLGEPTSTVSKGGAQHYATYWPNKIGIGFVGNPPWDPPSETDVCQLIEPTELL